MIVAPASSWRWWIDVRRHGSWPRPARTPSETGDHGGRAVVVPISASSRPVSCAIRRIDCRWQNRPWHGPIVTVVYRLASSSESNPSATARRMSFVVTSSQTQTKHLSAPSPSEAGGTLAAPISPVTDPTAVTFGGRSRGTKIPRSGSYSTRAPAWESSEYAGWRPPETTARSQPIALPSTTIAVTRPFRPLATNSRGSRKTPAICTPACSRSSTTSKARSSEAITTARSAGRIDHSRTRRRTAFGTTMPTRSFPGNTSGCSTVPVATTTCSARKR